MSFKKRVFFRIFPTERFNFDYVRLETQCNKIYVRHLQDTEKKSDNYWEFESDGIFFNCTQETVYEEVEKDVLENVINGYNAVILAFGQTGSGKTFTTSGLNVTHQEFGILPRIVKDLLELKKQEPKNIKICVEMSYVEFYNTYAVDLLRNLPNTIETYKCRNVRRVNILNELDALKCLFIGEGRKNFVERNTKYLSNVATSVVTFHVNKRNMDLSNPIKICSRLHIIDMAGNDTCANITKFYKNPKEIGLANITKSQMEQFILCLKENISENIRVRQRTNTLLYYLDGDLSHESILRFVGHIKVRTEDLVITLSMLRFGNIVQGLKMKKKFMKFDINEEIELTYLRNKLKSIEKEEHLNSVLLNQHIVNGMTSARLVHMKKLVHDYLEDEIEEITVMNVADTQIVLQYIKNLCRDFENDVKKLQAENQDLLELQNSDINLRLKNSKTSSQYSGTRLSRKASKLSSKESIKKEKRVSSSMMEKRTKTSISDDSHLPDLSSKRKKPFKSSHTLKVSSQSRSIEKRDSKTSLRSTTESQIPIPDMVPQKHDTWKRYTSNSSYKDLLEEYKQNEKDVRSIFIIYLQEVKKLQNCKDTVDKCSNDLIVAQTFRRFNSKDEFDENGVLILSFAEKECKTHLEEAQNLLVKQQEKVLTSQELLKAYLENRKNIIKKTEDEFDQFCIANYRLPSGELDLIQSSFNPYTFDTNFQYSRDVFESHREIAYIPPIPDETQTLRHLQQLMLRERKKRTRVFNEKKHIWKNY